ncbi:MAG: hypothetical protein WHT46_07225 [Candidatus Geothermincolales bacterium]
MGRPRLDATKTAAFVALLSLLVATLCGGCGREKGSPVSPREVSRENVMNGAYRVKVVEDGRVRGVFAYRAGSFRLVQAEAPRIIVFNVETGEAWEANTSLRTKRRISSEEAMARAGPCPSVVMRPYYDLTQYWEDGVFRMETVDGRRIEAFLDGPGHLPTSWSATRGKEALKSYRWEYYVGPEPADENFFPPADYAER